MKKRFWCILLTLCALLTVTALAADDAPEQEDLFYQYMLQLAREQTTPMLMRDQVDTAGSRLTGDSRMIYDQLVPKLKSIAQNGGSTVLTVSRDTNSRPDLDAITDALLVDMPYEMYWFDKTGGGCGVSYGTGFRATFTFAVSREYSDGMTVDEMGRCTVVDASRLTVYQVATAVSTANAVVAACASASDYEKLAAYKAWICENVSYNYYAANDNNNVPFGNPWQLIYVFDGDPNTNVVCEGYSKAFKFLCDLSTFSGETQCYLVTGELIGSNGDGGGHMWNIVTIGGKNYLVDVTNCDDKPDPDWLFLKGVTRPVSSGYKWGYVGAEKFADYAVNGLYSTVYYWYDPDLFWSTANPDILTLSTTDYVPFTPAWTAAPGGGYEYCLNGRTLYLKPTGGTTYLILARYEGGRMTEAKVKTVSGEQSVGSLTPGSWRVFRVDSLVRYIPQGTPLSLTVYGS